MTILAETLWQHQMVPRHYLCDEAEAEQVLKKWKVRKEQLPRIMVSDPAVKVLEAPVGSILKVERMSPTAGLHYAYRLVVEE